MISANARTILPPARLVEIAHFNTSKIPEGMLKTQKPASLTLPRSPVFSQQLLSSPTESSVAQFSLGERKWRILRLALRQTPFRFADIRLMSNDDRGQFDWLIEHGFVDDLGGDQHRLTTKGVEAADLGLYEVRLRPPPPREATRPTGKRV
jgi:hypothetical protein